MLFTVFRFTGLLACLAWENVCNMTAITISLQSVQWACYIYGLAGLNGTYFKVYFLKQKRRMFHTCRTGVRRNVGGEKDWFKKQTNEGMLVKSFANVQNNRNKNCLRSN